MRQLREGHDLTLIATGGILGEVLTAAKLLQEMSISCRVLSAHTIRPLDLQTLSDATDETGGLVTVEEHTVEGGLGSAVAEQLLESGHVPQRFSRIGLRDGFSSIVGSQQYLRTRYGLDADSIVSQVERLIRQKPVASHLASVG